MKDDNLKKTPERRDTVARERESGMEDTHKKTSGIQWKNLRVSYTVC